jgi:hypothetical protein
MLQFIIGYLFFNPIRGESNSPSITSSSIPSTSLSTSASISSSSSVSNTGSASATCDYRTYNAAADFSGTQGKNGWYYGYYNGAVFTQFTHYQSTTYATLGWNYNINSYGYITSNIIMPNGGSTCGTPSYGNIAPVLRWYNPINSCYQDVTITLSLSPGSTNVVPLLKANGNALYSPVNGVVYTNTFNVYDISSVELSVGPLNGNCNAAQTTFSLIISPIGPSTTSAASRSSSTSALKSSSSSQSSNFSFTPKNSGSSSFSCSNTGSILPSRSPSVSSSLSRSPRVSGSASFSATATATVFYSGNWTDYGNVYWNTPLTNTLSETISECMIRCSLNPLCGGISVNPPCNNIPLNSSDIYTTVCANCWTAPIDGGNNGVFVSAWNWKSFIVYDKMFPPTESSRASSTPTRTAQVSSSPRSTLTLSRSATSSSSSAFTSTNTGSVSVSRSPSVSPSLSRSSRVSGSASFSATATSTIFYRGNWTDLGQYNYALGDIANLGSMTINRCQINCFMNPLCGLIVVTSPCNSIPLDSPLVHTSVCGECWLKLTSGWVISADAISRSIMLYDRIYPPTTTSRASSTSSASSLPTSSVVLHSSYDMCASSGTTITLPFTGSSVTLRTNTIGTQYVNNLACNFYVNGGTGKRFVFSYQAFNTEVCCDWLTVFNVAGTQIRDSGILSLNTTRYVSDTSSIHLAFTTDNSVVSTGIIVKIELESIPLSETAPATYSYSPSRSASVSARGTYSINESSKSNSNSLSSTSSPLLSRTNTPSLSPTSSPLLSRTNTPSLKASYSPLSSKSVDSSPSSTNSPSQSSSNSISSSLSASASNSNSISSSSSVSSSEINSISVSSSVSNIVSESNIKSNSQSPSVSKTSTISPTKSSIPSLTNSLTISSSNKPTNSIPSKSGFQTETSLKTYSKANSPSPIRSVSNSYSNSYCITSTGILSDSCTIFSTKTPTHSSSSSAPFFSTLVLTDLFKENESLTMDSFSSFLGNRTNLDPSETTMIFNSISDLPASQIGDILKLAGVLTLNSNGGTFQYSSPSFNFKAAVLPPKPSIVSVSNLKINLPDLGFPNSAVSMIGWASNPYSSNQSIDSTVLSLSVSTLKGEDIPVNGLTQPIQLKFPLNLGNDNRLVPTKYVIDCQDDITYKVAKNKQTFLKLEKNSSGYIIPCANKDYIIDCKNGTDIKYLNCPIASSFSGKCMYWNNKLLTWTDDGCILISATSTELTCNCTHMTDFGSRLEAVFEANENIFAGASNVYSLDGLQKFKQFYITFGLLALFGFIVFGIGIYLDSVDSKKYFNVLMKDQVILKLKSSTNKLIDKCFDYEVVEDDKIEVKNTIIKKKSIFMIWSNRIFFQHPQISAFFKFDPKLSRLFRFLIIFVGQFNSLFITALLYAFRYGNGSEGSASMNILETIMLAALTALLNIPSLTILFKLVNAAGLDEFKWRYPILYEELLRRNIFEKELQLFNENELTTDNLNMKKINYYIELSKGNDNPNIKITNEDIDVDMDGDFDSNILYALCSCFKRNRKNNSNKGDINKAYVIASNEYPDVKKKSSYNIYLPFHTFKGGLSFFISIGWFIWCLNYLLLFAASHSVDVSNQMLTSFGISELTTVFFTQPITLLILIFLNYGIHKLRSRYSFLRKEKKVPDIYYFSDPFIQIYSTHLSTSFAYRIFLNGPSESSYGMFKNKELGYAPLDAIINRIDKDSIIEVSSRDKKLIELYEFMQYNKICEITKVIEINEKTVKPIIRRNLNEFNFIK